MILLIKWWSFGNWSNLWQSRLVAGLVPQSAHGEQFYSSCKFFLELFRWWWIVLFQGPSVSDKLHVLVDGCCSAASLVALLSQICGHPRHCLSSKLKLLLANCLNHCWAISSFTAPLPSTSPLFFLLLPWLYSFVSNNVWVVPLLLLFHLHYFHWCPYTHKQLTKWTMPKQRQHYPTYTVTRSQWLFQLSKISQQTVMYMKTEITYGTPSVY
jgi:hypothetical protein